jgi:hypothetical protein
MTDNPGCSAFRPPFSSAAFTGASHSRVRSSGNSGGDFLSRSSRFGRPTLAAQSESARQMVLIASVPCLSPSTSVSSGRKSAAPSIMRIPSSVPAIIRLSVELACSCLLAPRQHKGQAHETQAQSTLLTGRMTTTAHPQRHLASSQGYPAGGRGKRAVDLRHPLPPDLVGLMTKCPSTSPTSTPATGLTSGMELRHSAADAAQMAMGSKGCTPSYDSTHATT